MALRCWLSSGVTRYPSIDRECMEALEQASVSENSVPFADFLTDLVKRGLAGEALPAVPKTPVMTTGLPGR